MQTTEKKTYSSTQHMVHIQYVLGYMFQCSSSGGGGGDGDGRDGDSGGGNSGSGDSRTTQMCGRDLVKT